MRDVLRRLLDPAYLYAIDPGPLGRWWAVYVAWAAALFAGACVATWGWRRERNSPRGRALLVAAVSCAAGVATLGLRLVTPWGVLLPAYARALLLDVWTARVWPLSATIAAAGATGVAWLSGRQLPLWVRRHIAALSGALGADDAPLPWWANAAMLGVHALGLTCLWHAAAQPVWWAAPSLLALLLLPLVSGPRRVRLETLAPLLPAYCAAGAAMALERWCQIDTTAYQAFLLPDPWSPWFDVPGLALGGVMYVLWIQVALVARQRRRTLLPLLLGALVAAWLVATVAVHRTHGVTASDPYCYVQMAIDVVEQGTLLHDFPLAGLARELGLPTWPAVHVGYQPPYVENRSPTMWPPGWPLLMAPLYWAGGLEAVYFAAPLMALGSLLATWALVHEVLRNGGRARWAVAALTCALVATSPEGAERMLVPMADAAAQLFTLLALWSLLRGTRLRPGLHGLLAGLSFGMAYLVRHPQLPLGVAALAAAWCVSRGQGQAAWRHRALLLGAFAGAALLVALPDLWYHRTVFGGWLRTESTEWFLLSGRNVVRSAFSVLQQGMLRREELGFLVPFAFVGGWRLWVRERRAAAILGAGFVPVLAFHLTYEALRPRDLIAILPILYLCAAYGLVVIWRWARRQRNLLGALCLLSCAVLVGARSWRTATAPWREDVTTFGHISASQRQALEALRVMTPQDAVVGSMLNGGAIELHAGRQAVHPAPWTTQELRTWTDALLALDRPFYVLDDGEEMAPVLAELRAAYEVRSVQVLELPYFALGGGNLPRMARLYRVEQRR
ncbi:MAG: glycosyltransferase family 39 protein [Anaerolineae bacterium]|nr:glycosyltransferase family 39 protein [Anaerolineae bacterium]